MNRTERLAGLAEVEPTATASDYRCGLSDLAAIIAKTLIGAAFVVALVFGAVYG